MESWTWQVMSLSGLMIGIRAVITVIRFLATHLANPPGRAGCCAVGVGILMLTTCVLPAATISNIRSAATLVSGFVVLLLPQETEFLEFWYVRGLGEYPNEMHPEYCSFSFGHGGSATWNNCGDCATPYNEQGNMVNQKRY